jgi:hypothetical protein
MSKTITEIPYVGAYVGTKSEVVKNRFSGEEVTLTPEAVTVYDIIMGAESLGLYSEMSKGLGWFRENYPTEYMILLD